MDSNIPAKTRYSYFLKGRKDLHNYRTHMTLQRIIEVLHQKKFEKYEPLITSIKSNDSFVHLFAIKVNAKGYCSKPGKSCLSRPGFSGKHLKSTIKQLNLPSLKASFQIWFSRDYKRWLEEKVTIYPIKTFSNVAPFI